jgi:ribosomal protein S18 acetylase RimI-like enzyme
MSIDLRKATINDITALAEMNQQLIQDERSRNPLNVGQLKLRMQTWLDGSWSAVMIYKNDDLIGYLMYQQREDDYYPDQQVIYVRQFFVQRAYRRRGIGRQAFDKITTQYFPSDAKIMLDVLATNAEALSFWEDLGFQRYATSLQRNVTQSAQT